MYSTTTILPSSKKDVLPIHKTSNVIYKFTCKRCESAYIGRTSQRLGDRISQHVPRVFRNSITKSLHEKTETETSTHFLRKRIPTPLKLPSYVESAIGMHLLENPACAATYDDTDFKILSKPRNLFQLNVLEALYINSLKPTLCRQKKFVYFCRLFPNSFINKWFIFAWLPCFPWIAVFSSYFIFSLFFIAYFNSSLLLIMIKLAMMRWDKLIWSIE